MLPPLKRDEPCTFCRVTRYAIVFALGIAVGMAYVQLKETGLLGL